MPKSAHGLIQILSLAVFASVGDAVRSQKTFAACCCQVGDENTTMHVYEAIKGGLFRSMHMYAGSNKSSDKIGKIPKGAKVWALNEPQKDGWIQIAYVTARGPRRLSRRTAWSRFSPRRFKSLGTEGVKHTKCSMKAPTACAKPRILVAGSADESFCTSFLDNLPVAAETDMDNEQQRDKISLILQNVEDFHMNLRKELRTKLPEELSSLAELIEGHIKSLESAGFCVLWPPWCPIKHFQLKYQWSQMKSAVEKLVVEATGHAGSDAFAANVAKLRQFPTYKELAERVEGLEAKLIVAELKALDRSLPAQAFAWSSVQVSSTQLKAFCSGKAYFDGISLKELENPLWWAGMWDGCTGERPSTEEMLALEKEADETLHLTDKMAEHAEMKTVVASNRGVAVRSWSLAQVDVKADFTASLVDRDSGEQETQDGGDAILVFLMLTMMGVSTPLALAGGALAL